MASPYPEEGSSPWDDGLKAYIDSMAAEAAYNEVHALAVPFSGDMNTLTTPGTYEVMGGTNLPISGFVGIVEVTTGSLGIINQFAMSAGRAFIRLGFGSISGAWSEYGIIGKPNGGALTGTGSPEGVQTAAVGTRYIDTAKTNGALEWIKETGTGNTGWKVSHGDTGWRSVTLLNGWTATQAMIRRETSTVSIFIGGANGSAATADELFDVLAGFRPGGLGLSPRSPVAFGSSLDTSRVFVMDITNTNLRVLGAAYTGLTGGMGLVTYPTVEAWPAVLP